MNYEFPSYSGIKPFCFFFWVIVAAELNTQWIARSEGGDGGKNEMPGRVILVWIENTWQYFRNS